MTRVSSSLSAPRLSSGVSARTAGRSIVGVRLDMLALSLIDDSPRRTRPVHLPALRRTKHGGSRVRRQEPSVECLNAVMADWPGPRSRELQAERDRYVPRGMASTMPVFAAAASGASLTDVDGNRYIDFAPGISVMNLGHGHPRVLAAIRDKADRLVHSGAPVMMPEVYVR